MTSFLLLRSGAAALALTAAPPVAAQFVQVPTPTADALAAQMRQLGTNPRDVYALIAAGELSTKLGDPAAAMSFFARAQAIDPSNPRIPAGRAGALVLLERPGEALMLFAQAERAGVAMAPYLAQRGLAYDLTGQPGYAQRDYRQALLTGSDDETTRRLALSLGNSGRKDEALALLDPLLRRSDRGAWRARACILAVSGDVPGAQRIAASMMSGGAALSPFFARLPSLSLADRAFAVHFGSLAPTPTRLADARLAPPVVPLPVAPQVTPAQPVAVAAVATRATDPRTSRRTAQRTRAVRQPSQIADVAPAVIRAARQPSVQVATPAPNRAPQVAATPVITATPVQVVQTPVTVAVPDPQSFATLSSAIVATPVAQPAASPVLAPARSPIPTLNTPVASTPVVEQQVVPAPISAPPAAAPTVVPVVQVATVPERQPVPVAAPPSPPPVVVATPAPVRRMPEVARRNTALLGSIIETIAIPESELAAAPPAPVRRKPAAVEAKKAETKTADAKMVAAKKPDKAADAKKSDAKKKADAEKAEPKKPDPAKAEPARWWVQVAGGANAADLGKDWKRLTTKSPAAFKGRTPWTTPLRATNRLLAGPFKTQGEAGAFVNLLAKDGTSAFAWQSEAGQKIERLPSK